MGRQSEMIWRVQERQDVMMSKERFKLPELKTKMLSDVLFCGQGQEHSVESGENDSGGQRLEKQNGIKIFKKFPIRCN